MIQGILLQPGNAHLPLRFVILSLRYLVLSSLPYQPVLAPSVNDALTALLPGVSKTWGSSGTLWYMWAPILAAVYEGGNPWSRWVAEMEPALGLRAKHQRDLENLQARVMLWGSLFICILGWKPVAVNSQYTNPFQLDGNQNETRLAWPHHSRTLGRK